jgi:hypothetical protein
MGLAGRLRLTSSPPPFPTPLRLLQPPVVSSPSCAQTTLAPRCSMRRAFQTPSIPQSPRWSLPSSSGSSACEPRHAASERGPRRRGGKSLFARKLQCSDSDSKTGNPSAMKLLPIANAGLVLIMGCATEEQRAECLREVGSIWTQLPLANDDGDSEGT